MWTTRIVNIENATGFEKSFILKNIVSQKGEVVDWIPWISNLSLNILLFSPLIPLLFKMNNFKDYVVMPLGLLLLSGGLAMILKYKAWMWHGFIAVESRVDWGFYIFQLLLISFVYIFLLNASIKMVIKYLHFMS